MAFGGQVVDPNLVAAQAAAQAAQAAQATPAATGTRFEQFLDRTKKGAQQFGANTRVGAAEFNRPNFVELEPTVAGRAGRMTQGAADFISKTGFNPLLAGGFAGVNSLMNGGGVGEVLGSTGGAAGLTALAGRLAAPLSNMGTFGKIGAAAISIAAPMIGASMGGGMGKGIQNMVSPGVEKATQIAGAGIDRSLNPQNPSNIISTSEGKFRAEDIRALENYQRTGVLTNDQAEDYYNRVTKPTIQLKASLTDRSLPLHTMAKNSITMVDALGRMGQEAVRGNASIAANAVSSNPFGQLIVG